MTPRVLLVDDEEVFRTTLAKVLRARGMEVRDAPGGEEALARLRESPADVVVLDLRMPGLDGLETLKRIVALQPDVKVVILTGHGTVQAGLEALSHLAFDFLQKPVGTDRLVEVILASTEERRAGEGERP